MAGEEGFWGAVGDECRSCWWVVYDLHYPELLTSRNWSGLDSERGKVGFTWLDEVQNTQLRLSARAISLALLTSRD